MTLRLVAMRHAKPTSEGYSDETLRPLSKEGLAHVEIVAKKCKSEGIIPTTIFSSPILRAQQTAEALLRHFEKCHLLITPALGYEFDKGALLASLASSDKDKTLFLVGHAPHLAEFVNEIVGEVVLPQGLSTCSAAVVDFPESPDIGNGLFHCLIKP